MRSRATSAGRSARLKPRKVPRQSRSKATWDAIVSAAAQVFAREGFEDGAVARIAAVAGVSIGSLYQYFPTKDALIQAVRERASVDIIADLEPALLRLAGEPIRGGAVKLAGLLIDAHSRYADLMRALVASPQPGEPDSSRAFMARLHTGVLFYLEAHRAELRPVDLELAATVLVAAVDGALRAVVIEPAGRRERAHVVDEIAALIVGYLAR
jgi:AcrR family transcriptional regulator